MAIKPAPLNSSFMLTAMLGLLISVMYVYKLDPTWGFAFIIIFSIMVIASLISMVEAPVKGQLMPKLEAELKHPYAPAMQAAKPKQRKAGKKKSSKKKAGKRGK